jgi:hypothetical protein
METEEIGLLAINVDRKGILLENAPKRIETIISSSDVIHGRHPGLRILEDTVNKSLQHVRAGLRHSRSAWRKLPLGS